ncbi:competence protein CoiA [Streptomyces agglomeratus]|uniref:competence protein CoiA family protein n=1 Tax=Streptomyces agglomeratus TaxID=285458 RepID=UPI0008525466|nr:competence protein CoiA family protein [Streptomyces agglomeratus]OEJ37164.1 competence protein CoiA [Streptomyces agglomeratus]OEJ48517.1 competence protein CoiA [Streptomyces agglomeratus]OEJ57017.1 competence protein CoiA [Streptomyces agglomeratus]
MGYTAVHADWGRLDASRGDLGCGRAWADVHRVKGLVLTCPECRGRVFARVSHYSVRHFYHQVRPENCELANESPEHHLLKLELAMAARAAGWRAELEVSNEARTWRADAMVFDEHGRPFMALEAQLSPLTPDEARMRTDRYAQDGVAVCWVALEDRPWERIVPSLRVRLPRLRGESWTVWHGMARYTWAPRTLKAKAKWVHITCTLGEAVQWILEKRVHAFTGPNGTVRWTTPPYEQLAIVRARMEAEAETAKRAADAQQRRKETEQRAEERRRLAQQRARERKAEVQRLKPFFEQTGLDAMAWQVFTQMVRSASGKAIQYGTPGPAYGDGLPVYARPRWESVGFQLSGVVCPNPEALAGWPKGLTILVPNQTWLSRIQAAARTPLKVAVLDPVTGHSNFVRVTPHPASTRP